MTRTRTAILDAAATCVEQEGVGRTTMSGIAAAGGVAKATLYNHFRTKDDVLAALVEARTTALVQACSGRPLAEALEHAAAVLREDAALRRVAADEPARLLPLLAPGQGRAWEQACSAVAELAGEQRGELVLRWLVGQLLWPLDPGTAGDQAQVLAGGAPPGGSPVPERGTPESSAGLGWPAGPDRLRSS